MSLTCNVKHSQSFQYGNSPSCYILPFFLNLKKNLANVDLLSPLNQKEEEKNPRITGQKLQEILSFWKIFELAHKKTKNKWEEPGRCWRKQEETGKKGKTREEMGKKREETRRKGKKQQETARNS